LRPVPCRLTPDSSISSAFSIKEQKRGKNGHAAKTLHPGCLLDFSVPIKYIVFSMLKGKDMPCKMFDFSGSREWPELLALLEKRNISNPDTEKIVAGIIEEIQARGDEALIEYTRKFDCPGFNISHLRVSPQGPCGSRGFHLPRRPLSDNGKH
jgi:Histidinol dehydrogenase